MRSPSPVIIAIDVEPDDLLPSGGEPSPWEATRSAFRFAEWFRGHAERENGAAAGLTWTLRMDPQIERSYGCADYAARLLGAEFERVDAAGDEIGLHAHFFRWREASSCWSIEHGVPEWVAHWLLSSFAAFERAFGRKCRTYRGGDRWHDDAAVRIVQALGVRFDLTPERRAEGTPTLRPSLDHSGRIPDYTHVPVGPYQPSSHDFREASTEVGSDFWMLPLAGGGRGVQPAWRRPWLRALVSVADPFRRFDALYAPYTCRLTSTPDRFRERFDAYRREEGVSCAVLAIRASDLAPGVAREHTVANLDYVIRRLRRRGVEFCTPARALELLGYGRW